jgi:D-alanine transaminase
VIVHLNGKLLAAQDARISPFDRGFVFGDGVYEGLRAIPTNGGLGRRIIGAARHIDRIRTGLGISGIQWDPSHLEQLSAELVAANNFIDAFVYWQVTRGTPGPGEPVRSRAVSKTMTPTVFGYCTQQPPLDSFKAPPTKSVITCEDRRWAMGHLKSISLMGNIISALEADRAGADEAIFLQKGLVAEGLATNVLLALPRNRSDGPTTSDPTVELVTPSLTSVSILSGVTRGLLLKERPDIVERAVTPQDLAHATEVMLIGTTTFVTSVVKLNGQPIGDGTPGPIARSLLVTLMNLIREGRDIEEP